MLQNMQGNTIPAKERKRFEVEDGTDECGKKASIGFVVRPVKQPILWVGKFIEHGYRFEIENGDGFLSRGEHRVPVVMRRNRSHIEAKVVDEKNSEGKADFAAVLAEEQSGLFDEASRRRELRSRRTLIYPDSSIDLTRHRLKEPGEPIWGTQARLWTTLEAVVSRTRGGRRRWRRTRMGSTVPGRRHPAVRRDRPLQAGAGSTSESERSLSLGLWVGRAERSNEHFCCRRS